MTAGKVKRRQARLTPSANALYQGNILIEALPPFDLTNLRFFKEKLSCFPQASAELAADANCQQKIDWLGTLPNRLFVTLPRHLELISALDVVIRTGYLHREPFELDWKHGDLPEDSAAVPEPADPAALSAADREKLIAGYYDRTAGADKYDEADDAGSLHHAGTALTLAVIGCSGVGKSYAAEKILALYPQVIYHPKRIINPAFTQVVWLKVECPAKCSIKSLCSAVLKELDLALGMDKYRGRITQRMTIDFAREYVVQALQENYVGILVIDEIQNMLSSKADNMSFFNFIVGLSNTVNIPILFLGTPKIKKFLDQDFRVARRFSILGFYEWSRLSRSGKGSLDWEVMCSALADYNLTEPSQGLLPEVKESLYECSQGITAVLVELYFLAQMDCLNHNIPLSPKAVKGVYEEKFKPLHKVLGALARGDVSTLDLYDDVLLAKECFSEAAGYYRRQAAGEAGAGASAADLETQIKDDVRAGAEKIADSLIDVLRSSSGFNGTAEEIEQLREDIIKDVINNSGAREHLLDFKEKHGIP